MDSSRRRQLGASVAFGSINNNDVMGGRVITSSGTPAGPSRSLAYGCGNHHSHS